MDTIPKELVSLIQSASKPAAPAAQTAQAPSASAKASTDLLQGLVDAKKGKPDETLKSKLTDTDTLIRFAAGLGAILSGEAGMGAALVGAGFANAGQEAADDNEKRDEEADALTLKLAQSAADRENKVFQMGLTNQEYIMELGPAFDTLAGVDGSGMYEGISNSLTNKENLRIAEEFATAASNLPSGSPERIALVSKSLKLARIPDLTGEVAEGLATDKPDYELARRVGSDMDKASYQQAYAQLMQDGDFQKYYRSLKAPDGRLSMSSGYSDYLQWQMTSNVLAKAIDLYEKNPDKYADALDAMKRAPEITPQERAAYAMSAKDIPEKTLMNEDALRFDLEYFTKEKDYWRAQLTEQNAVAFVSNDPDIRKLFLQPSELEAKAHELATNSTKVYLETRYGTALLRTEAMRARLDPDGTRAAELPGRIAQAKASLLSEGYDPSDPLFEQAVVQRTYEQMNGLEVTEPVLAKARKAATKADETDRKTPAEVTAEVINTGIAKTVVGISNLLN